MSDRKIVQIVPAAGVQAAYKDDSGEFVCDVLIWALYDNGEVCPIGLDEEGQMQPVTELENFIRLQQVSRQIWMPIKPGEVLP